MCTTECILAEVKINDCNRARYTCVYSTLLMLLIIKFVCTKQIRISEQGAD